MCIPEASQVRFHGRTGEMQDAQTIFPVAQPLSAVLIGDAGSQCQCPTEGTGAPSSDVAPVQA